MTSHRQILTGTTSLALGQIMGQGSVFVRNVIVARILTREHFGIAATFAITVALLEMMSNLAADRMLVQADDGDDERFLATAHLYQVIRGVVSGLVLLLIAGPVATLFDVPEATWAFRMLAIVPMLRGMMHLDAKRFHRRMRFGPDVIVETGGNVLPMLVAWPIAVWLQSYSVVLWLLMIQAIVNVVISHALAERPYRWALDSVVFRRMIGFGWPLLLDGLVLFGIYQGDRVMIGASYSMADLGRYSIALGLTFIPALMATRVMTGLFLPLMSRVKNDPVAFDHRVRLATQSAALVAAAMLIGFVVAGNEMLVLLYGAKYADVGVLLTWLAALHAVRILRMPTVLAAMAKADTRTILIGNVVRATALAATAFVAWRGADLKWIAVCGLGGEIAALGVGLALGRMRHGVSIRGSMRPLVLVAGAGAFAFPLAGLDPASWWARAGLVALGLTVVAMAAGLLPELRSETRRAFARRTPSAGIEPVSHP